MSRRTAVTLIVSAGVFVASLDLFIVNIAFPDIARDFPGTSFPALSWILSAYAIVFAALLVPSGRWADREGRKRWFLAGFAVFTAASAACAAAPSVDFLIGARVVQAMGAAFMLPTSLGLLLPEYPPEKRPMVIGIWAATAGAAAAAGPPIGGLLVEASWRWVFLVNVPIGIAAIVAGTRTLHEIRDPSGGRPDVAGAGLLITGIGALTLAIVQGPDWGWGGARVVGLFAAAAGLLTAFVARSRTHSAPVVEPELVRVRSVAIANAAGLLFFAGFGAFLLASALFLTTVWHESVLRAGLQLAPGPATAALFAVPGGLLGDRYGQRIIGAIGSFLFAASAIWWVSRMGAQVDYAGVFLPASIVGGAGVGLTIPSISAAATAELPPTRFATGTAVLTMSRQIGLALGVAILVAIIGTPAPQDAVAAFGHGSIFIAAATGGAGLLFLGLGPVRVFGRESAPAALELAA